jgi:hypothetical protein
VCALFALPGPAQGQQGRLDRPLRVFLDCNGFYCDLDFFIEEVQWVSFVRDRQDADVHVLGTRQSTGAGGSAYTLEFRGLRTFAEERLTLGQTSAPDATDSDIRSALVEVIKLGLAPFAAATPAPPIVQIQAPASADAADAGSQEDPWNRWNFRIGVNGYLSGESQQRFRDGFGSLSAGRVTNDWKLQLRGSGSFSESEFELNDSTTFVSNRESYSATVLTVRSVGTNWAVGGITSWSRSTYNNYDTSLRLAPALEYNVFPYSESTRRLFTFLYAIGPRYNDYGEVTIFGKASESLLEHLLVAAYDVTQPWGNIDVSLRGTHYITRFGDGQPWPDPQYNITLFGSFEVRLIKGLSANMFGHVEMVRGQIQLPAAGLSEEEILTRQRELATSYRYFASFGLSYRFGSIFSDVVNPRFDDLY